MPMRGDYTSYKAGSQRVVYAQNRLTRQILARFLPMIFDKLERDFKMTIAGAVVSALLWLTAVTGLNVFGAWAGAKPPRHMLLVNFILQMVTMTVGGGWIISHNL